MGFDAGRTRARLRKRLGRYDVRLDVVWRDFGSHRTALRVHRRHCLFRDHHAADAAVWIHLHSNRPPLPRRPWTGRAAVRHGVIGQRIHAAAPSGDVWQLGLYRHSLRRLPRRSHGVLPDTPFRMVVRVLGRRHTHDGHRGLGRSIPAGVDPVHAQSQAGSARRACSAGAGGAGHSDRRRHPADGRAGTHRCAPRSPAPSGTAGRL